MSSGVNAGQGVCHHLRRYVGLQNPNIELVFGVLMGLYLVGNDILQKRLGS